MTETKEHPPNAEDNGNTCTETSSLMVGENGNGCTDPFFLRGDERLSEKAANASSEKHPSILEGKYSEVKSSSEAFDVLLQHVGGLGKWQWCMFFITSFCGIFTAFHNLAAAFLAAVPEHWCRVPALDYLDTSADIKNISIPWENSDHGEGGEFSSCLYYNRDWPSLVESGVLNTTLLPDLPTNVSTAKCQEWHYDHSVYVRTIVEEWNLVCDQKYLMSVVQSTFMVGVLIGAVVLSELSDKFGRRTISLWSALGFLICSVSVTFSTHYVTFIVLRFLVAAFGSGLFLPNFVLLMEVVGSEGRTIMGMLYQGFFAVGFMLLPAIAYFVRSWRYLELCISIPSSLMLLYYWFLPESPRWLMIQGRYQEGLDVLERAAKVNGRALPSEDEIEVLISKMREEEMRIAVLEKEYLQEAEHGSKETSSCLGKVLNIFRSGKTLMSTPNIRRRCLIIFFAWFVVSMVYYGLTFSGGNIDASIYLMVFLSGLVEIPSYLLVTWTVNKFGRRLNLCILFLICGVACLAILAVPKEYATVNLTLATIGKFFNSSAFAVAYIYSAELVPTAVRNIAVGTSSMSARMGSCLAPFIVDLLGDVHYTVPSTVFGLLSIVAGLLTLLLPETGNKRLPETVEEVEAMPR